MSSIPFDTAPPTEEATETIQEEEKDNVLFHANEDQTEAGKLALNRLNGPPDEQGGWKLETKIDGKAGVGKTWLAKRIVEGMKQVTQFDQTIWITAPTHEAVAQLRQNFADQDLGGKVRFGTLQSVLNLKVRWVGGTRKLKKDKSRGGWSPEPNYGDVLIIDESSMLGVKDYQHIRDFIDTVGPIRILYLGDDGQLPPVKDKPAGVLDKEGPTLTKIVRQNQGSAILEAASIVREGGPRWKQRWLQAGDQDEFLILDGKKEMRNATFEAFESDNGLYDTRLLCFRNARVDAWNRRIRNHRYPDAPEWAEGMKAMSTGLWKGPDHSYGPMHTSQVFRVESAERKMAELAKDEHDSSILPPMELEVWELELDPARSDFSISARVPTANSEEAYEEEVRRRKSKCKSGDLHWSNFYMLREALAPLTWGYASTVHKAQGATIRQVLVDVNDIFSAPGGDHQTQPLTYVATTRASEELVALNNT